jgi:glycerol-3-phosphate dehydrogenase
MKARKFALEAIKNRIFDLVIVGGGIVGAGIALDAAARGLSVLLLEKGDFASGTSSRTTKLIHGGLRYLEQLLIRLTRELCQERGLLESLAPHLVKDFSFILPLAKSKRFFGFKAGLGLTIYDFLSRKASGIRFHKRLNIKETLAAAPGLCAKLIRGGLRFHDCISDDSRMVMEVIKKAESFGAVTINYLEAVDFECQEDGRIKAVICQDQNPSLNLKEQGKAIRIACRACVNACGVWSDELLTKLDPSWTKKVTPAKGTHIMLPLSRFPTSTALFLPTNDKRYVFVVPWQNELMVGTTDIDYKGPLDDPQATPEEVDYLLAVLNSYSDIKDGSNKLTRKDVLAAWAGLRPLVAPGDSPEEITDTGSLSREHSLFEGPGGIIGLIGGKLTNFRMLSIHVVDMVLEQLRSRWSGYETVKASSTEQIMLGGWLDRQDFEASAALIRQTAQKLNLSQKTAEHLLGTYGKDALKVLDRVRKQKELAELISEDFAAIMAEIPYCLEEEMALGLEDLLARRIRLGFVNQEQCLQVAPKVTTLIQALGYWNLEQAQKELRNFQEKVQTQLRVFQKKQDF